MTQSSSHDVSVGDRLPDLTLPMTRSLIVATAIASRDYQPVHHDAQIARERGSKDIFMNILTTQGLVSRFVTDWAGPGARVVRNAIRLGAPNYPGDVLTLSGDVSARREDADGVQLDIGVTGRNGIGDHVVGTVTVLLGLRAR